MNARKPRTKSKNFSSEETTRLLDLVEEFKPFGGNMWDRVAFEYNRTGQSNWPERDGISLRRRFQGLNNKTKPTGTAYCPPNIERAKRLYSAIESKVGAMELHDQQEFGDAASERSDAGSDGNIPQEVSEAVEELVVSSRIGTDAAGLLTNRRNSGKRGSASRLISVVVMTNNAVKTYWIEKIGSEKLANVSSSMKL
ncbi:hypothetical protein B5M09_011994 [Aphanomyces astaci]|uniref:DUF6818 domain-containing protein n=1 Tax=Aphanomyces astaci TaxID=112090 RepID=A0A425CT26_APHAT|nr:hypothetical protein B5M09_011994 [Aphanomyces astaci]